jgi:carbonic anhydrase
VLESNTDSINNKFGLRLCVINMRVLSHLFTKNRAWAAGIMRHDPEFFERLSRQQAPQYLWVGCSDSRVPANQIVGLLPGEMFVHRNVGNVVVHTDLNCLSAIQFAVDVLRVRHIIVCGHYGCGGVVASLKRQRQQGGLIDNWLYGLTALYDQYRDQIDALPKSSRVDALCEINVIEQVRHVCHTSMLQRAWERGQSLAVHGWIYGIHDGHLHDLGATISSPDEVEPVCMKLLRGPRRIGGGGRG